MIQQRHWDQSESLSSLNDRYFNDELTSVMTDFIRDGNYKNYYTNHVVVEVYKNVARLFNKNTETYIAIGFFNINEND